MEFFQNSSRNARASTMIKTIMKKYLFLFCSWLIAHNSLLSQDIFIAKGKIEFEKRVNTYNALDDIYKNRNSSFDFISTIKKQIPEWNTTYFNLIFDENKTIYKPGREVSQVSKGPEWFQDPAQSNIVFCNLETQKSISQKSVFESVFLLSDSLRKARWKITNDFRDIAGFNCRKATTIIMDSVFVVAFYTDQITTSGGPESFNGLPGMILGLAIPRLHTTWFATKVELVDPPATEFIPPVKGKKATNADLIDKLQSSFKDAWNPAFAQHAQWVIGL
jgi:GLPGLI family protein